MLWLTITVPNKPCEKYEDGIIPHIDSETGNWFLGDEDTGVKAQGDKGKQGRKGKDGVDGKDGKDGECDCENIKVPICHNGNNIEVSINALGAHLDHGDTIGLCPVERP